MKKQLLLAGAALTSVMAWAQPTQLQHFGHFKRMMHTGQTGGQVQLANLDSTAGMWGVGALAGLRGEVIQVDGKLLVSRGSEPGGKAVSHRPDDSAVLWAGAKVEQWVGYEVPTDMAQGDIEAFAKSKAKRQALDPEQPFVFRISGNFTHLVWHVVTGEKPAGTAGAHGGHGHRVPQSGAAHANRRSGMKVFRYPGASGQLVGIYSGAGLEGVVSHPGERFHVHYVNDELSVSGHVDQYNVRAGATLWLPKR